MQLTLWHWFISYALSRLHASSWMLGSEQIRNAWNCYQFSDVSVSGLGVNGLYIGEKKSFCLIFCCFVLNVNSQGFCTHSVWSILHYWTLDRATLPKKRSSKMYLSTLRTMWIETTKRLQGWIFFHIDFIDSKVKTN